MYDNEIKERKERALQEAKSLERTVITNGEFETIWFKHLYGFLATFKFKEILLENGIEAENS